MSLKRVLIIQENRLLSSFYRESLENGGFLVESVESGDAALELMKRRQPDAVVIDSLIPGREADEVIREIRAQPATHSLPVVALPGSRAPITKAVQQAGATRVLSRALNMPAELTDAVQSALGHDRTATLDRCVPLRPDANWLKLNSAEAGKVLNNMRRGVQSAAQETGRKEALRNLLQCVHSFAEQAAMFEQKPVFHLASALEGLVFDLNRFPEQANPSTLRTIGQAIDFSSVLLQESHRREIPDTSNAQILVVDDEDGARKIIMAAMGMVNLKSIAAETPTSALSTLKTQGFDLIFLDVGLPEMDGFDLCHRIRGNPLHEKTPIVFITGMASFQNRVQSSLSGGNDFVGKPFNLPELGVKAMIWVQKAQLALI